MVNEKAFILNGGTEYCLNIKYFVMTFIFKALQKRYSSVHGHPYMKHIYTFYIF